MNWSAAEFLTKPVYFDQLKAQLRQSPTATDKHDWRRGRTQSLRTLNDGYGSKSDG